MSASATNNNNNDEDEASLFDVDAKHIREVVMGLSQWNLDSIGGVDRFVKMSRFFEKKNHSKSSFASEEEFIREFGISSATIGERIEKFGSGDMKIRDHPRFTASLANRHINLISDLSFMEDPYKIEQDEDDSFNYFSSGRGLRFADHVQNRALYEVVRDGEKIQLYGSQLVFGDILILEENRSKNVPLEEFEKKIRKERVAKKENSSNFQEKKKNKDDDDEDNEKSHEPAGKMNRNNHNDDDEETNHKEKQDGADKKTKKEEEREREERNRRTLQWSRLTRAHQTKVPADCLVLEGEVEQDCVDLTGESPIYACSRKRNAQLIAGARIVSGKCRALVVGVGQNSNLGIFYELFLERQDQDGSFKRCRGKSVHCCCCC